MAIELLAWGLEMGQRQASRKKGWLTCIGLSGIAGGDESGKHPLVPGDSIRIPELCKL